MIFTPDLKDPDIVVAKVEFLPGAAEKGYILPRTVRYHLRTGKILDEKGLECAEKEIVELVMAEVRRRIYGTSLSQKNSPPVKK
jgi:hypothetical protein